MSGIARKGSLPNLEIFNLKGAGITGAGLAHLDRLCGSRAFT